MAKDFNTAMNASMFRNVAQTSREIANVIQVRMISTNDLEDNPKNGEDIVSTGDLELSIQQNGFIDPIEVTNFNMPLGKYMIVSGHRRRAAGVKVGMTEFPCIIKTFHNANDVNNYALLANSQRDSAKDPLLYCKRYKMHEVYLKESGFKGSIREEIARRLGMSIPQVDRYRQMNSIILDIWGLVQDEKVGMSSVLPIAQFTQAQQYDIYDILVEGIALRGYLSRTECKEVIDAYRNGIRFNFLAKCRKEEMELEQAEQALQLQEADKADESNDKKSVFSSIDFSSIDLSSINNTDNTEVPTSTDNTVNTDNLVYGEIPNDAGEPEEPEEPETPEHAKKMEALCALLEANFGRPIAENDDVMKVMARLTKSIPKMKSFKNKSSAEQMVLSMTRMVQVLANEINRIVDEYELPAVQIKI